jgi:hypothetical protein
MGRAAAGDAAAVHRRAGGAATSAGAQGQQAPAVRLSVEGI